MTLSSVSEYLSDDVFVYLFDKSVPSSALTHAIYTAYPFFTTISKNKKRYNIV